jgi:hypothetical protein
MKANLSTREFEQLSAYLDGQLSPAESKQLEGKLHQNPDWKLALDDLAATRRLLRSAPRYRAPRNFTISAETARQMARKPLFPAFPAFRFSAALALFAVLAVAALQLIGFGAPAASQVAMVPQAAPAADAALQEKSAAAEPSYTFEWTEPQPMAGGDGSNLSDAAKNGSVAPAGSIVTYGDQTRPQLGMGGGGGPGQTYILPPNAVPESQGMDLAAPTQTTQPNAERAAVSGEQANNPILGLPAPEESGKILSPGPEIREAGSSETQPQETNLTGLSSLRVVQIGLGALALLAIAAALIFRARRL